MTLTLTLPLPDKRLSPNGTQPHYMVKADLVRTERAQACLIARQALGGGEPPRWAACEATMQFTFPDRRRRDLQNYFAAAKAMADGITDAEIWKDDSGVCWILPPPLIDKQSPGVTITITELGE